MGEKPPGAPAEDKASVVGKILRSHSPHVNSFSPNYSNTKSRHFWNVLLQRLNLKIQRALWEAWFNQMNPLKAQFSLPDGRGGCQRSQRPSLACGRKRPQCFQLLLELKTSPALVSQQENKDLSPTTTRNWILPPGMHWEGNFLQKLHIRTQPGRHLDSSLRYSKLKSQSCQAGPRQLGALNECCFKSLSVSQFII